MTGRFFSPPYFGAKKNDLIIDLLKHEIVVHCSLIKKEKEAEEKNLRLYPNSNT